MRAIGLLLGASLGVLSAKAGTAGGAKKCKGSYSGAVVNLCDAHWPDAKATRVWLVVFYATW